MVGSTRAPFYCWVAGPETQNGVPVSPENSTAEDEIRGLKKGLLFPYSESETIYHCPSDTRYLKPPTTVNGTGVGGYRSFSLVGGIGPNSQNEIAWHGYFPHLKISTIRSPGDKYILVEEADGRGLNVNSWIIKPQTPNTWIDPIAIWHLKHSTLGFADGHGQKHRWEDKSTILMAKEQRTNFGDIGPGEGGDLAFMIRGFPFERYYSPDYRVCTEPVHRFFEDPAFDVWIFKRSEVPAAMPSAQLGHRRFRDGSGRIFLQDFLHDIGLHDRQGQIGIRRLYFHKGVHRQQMKLVPVAGVQINLSLGYRSRYRCPSKATRCASR